MNVNNLSILKNIKTRLCALSLAGVMAVTMAGCSNSKSNNSSERQKEITTSYIDSNSPEIAGVETLINGEKRGIILSDEPHLYESIFEKTDTKVYLSDEDGNRLSNNFDEISLLSNYRHLTAVGALLGSWVKVDTDKQYDYFVGETLRKDLNDSTLNPRVTLLDNNGMELCSFDGHFEALIGNTVVIENYFEGEDRNPLAPDTYFYNYETGKTSKKYDWFYFHTQIAPKEKASYLIGVDYDYGYDIGDEKMLYTFYDENLEIVGTSTKEEIEEWYISKNDYNSYLDASGDYQDYFESFYATKNKKQTSAPILIKH